MLTNLRNIFLVAFFLGIVVSSKISLAYTLGSALGFSLISMLLAVVLFCIPSGLYWVFTKRALPNQGIWLWIIWVVVAVVFVGGIVNERLMAPQVQTVPVQAA